MTGDIDLYSPSTYERGMPHPQFTWLRANAPVFWHPEPPRKGPGFWALTRHQDIAHVSRHPELFSSWRGTAMLDEHDPETKAVVRLAMLSQDPPQHTRNRQLVSRAFTPRAAARLEPRIRRICHQLIDDLADRDQADFVADIAAPLPLRVICELIGAPAEDHDKIFGWSNQMIGAQDPEFAQTGLLRAGAQLASYGADLAANRSRCARDDIITTLAALGDNGQRLDRGEIGMFVVLLAVAGNETTRNAASGGMLALLQHPAQWDRLRHHRQLLSTAADEIIRWVSPVIQFRRTATCATQIGGHDIAEGDKIVMYYPSANRDETVFTDPGNFDIARDPNPHLGFGGGGPHHCLGAHLARIELRALFDALADRLPDIELAGDVQRLRSNFINGIKHMPIRFTPPAPRN